MNIIYASMYNNHFHHQIHIFSNCFIMDILHTIISLKIIKMKLNWILIKLTNSTIILNYNVKLTINK